MDGLTPFIITSVILTGIALILQGFTLRQLIHDIVNRQRLRPLIVCHYFNFAASFIIWILCIDSQGGLGFYSQAVILFIANIKSFLIVASARALAAGFVDSHKLMTTGPATARVSTETIVHSILSVIALTLFIVLAATRYTWLSVTAKSIISLYGFVVAAQVIISTARVRRILKEENQRTGSYAEGIRKLTRLIVLVVILVIVGNIAVLVGVVSDVALARTNMYLFDGKSPFAAARILGDVSGMIAIFALLTGSWNIGKISDVTPSSKKTRAVSKAPTTTVPTESSGRASTITTIKESGRTETSTGLGSGPLKRDESDTQLCADLVQRMSTGSLYMKDGMSREPSKEVDGNCVVDVS